jgi:alpha-L-rhamnosidase
MAKWISHMSGFIENDLITKDNYGDWCVPPEDPELIHSVDPGRKTHPTLIATSYFCHNLSLMSRYARLLGKPDDAARYAGLSGRMTAALNQKFYDPAKGFYDNGSQTSCVLPLAFGLVPEAERAKVFKHLVHKITVGTQGHMGTGLVGGQWLGRVLTEGGMADLVRNFATQTDYPSWGYMTRNGATTVWELWNGNTANPAMNSGNHVMLVGDFIIWLYESLAGIKADSAVPGFKHIMMKPEPVDGIVFARANHHSPYGEVRSEWKSEGETFEWSITVPPNCTATAFVPCTDAATLREAGKEIAASLGVKLTGMKDGRALLELAAGTYHFTSR